MEASMDRNSYRRVFTQFLNGYWGAFHEVLEAQSVNRHMLAGSLYNALVDEHRRFAAAYDGRVPDPSVVILGRLWQHITARREVTADAPLSAHEVAHARKQFELLYDTLIAYGRAFPDVRAEVLSHPVHSTPTAPLRADAAR
jgi:hypothetical protein